MRVYICAKLINKFNLVVAQAAIFCHTSFLSNNS